MEVKRPLYFTKVMPLINMLRLYSGYYVSFTRWRSRVRSPPGVLYHFSNFFLFQNTSVILFHSFVEWIIWFHNIEPAYYNMYWNDKCLPMLLKCRHRSTCFGCIVFITSALHAEGRGFEIRLEYSIILVSSFCFKTLA